MLDWLAKPESGLSDFVCTVEKLKNADTFGSFRIVCANWPVKRCMLASGNWSKADLVARDWKKPVQMLGIQTRIRRFIGGVTKDETLNNNVTFLKTKLVERYSAFRSVYSACQSLVFQVGSLFSKISSNYVNLQLINILKVFLLF